MKFSSRPKRIMVKSVFVYDEVDIFWGTLGGNMSESLGNGLLVLQANFQGEFRSSHMQSPRVSPITHADTVWVP